MTDPKPRFLLAFAPLSLAAAALLLPSCETYESAYHGHHRDIDDDVTYRVGTTYRELPRGYRTVEVDRDTYYYHDGHYFTRRGNTYVVAERPLHYPGDGHRHHYDPEVYHRTLPASYRTVNYRNRDYYFSDGVYYRPRGRGYVTVSDPFRY